MIRLGDSVSVFEEFEVVADGSDQFNMVPIEANFPEDRGSSRLKSSRVHSMSCTTSSCGELMRREATRMVPKG